MKFDKSLTFAALLYLNKNIGNYITKMNSFTPAIALMNRLKYPQKFALISFVFILPLSLLMYLLLSEVQSRIDFAKKEMLGNVYLRSLRQLSAAIPQLQILDERSPTQEQASDKINQLQSQVTANFQSLETVERKLGKILLTTDKFQPLKQSLQSLQQNQNIWSSETKIYYYNTILRGQVDELRSRVGDQSNLILDPDLDTYYLMDATLLKLPAMQKVLVDIQLLTQRAILSQQYTPLERAQLIMLLGNLKNYNNELTKNMEVAFSNNPAGNLQPKLKNNLASFTNQVQQLTDMVEQLVNTDTIPQADLYYSRANQNLQQSFLLWDQIIDELDLLLQYRINGFMRRQIFMSVFVLIVLTIVVYLFIGFYRGVMQTVSSLSAASKQMVEGSLSETITLDNRDELAEVVRAFNNIALALVKANQEITLLNDRLQAENIRMSAELDITRKLQQMILPKDQELKEIPALDIAGFMKPAHEVGGDYYDVLQHNGAIKIGIGDVTGHGLESGVLMIMVQTAVRTLLANNETDPVNFFKVLNQTIYDNVQRMKSDKNLTLVLLDYHEGVLRLSGQHEEIIVMRSNGTIERIDTIDLGFPIGLEADITDFVAHTEVQLNPGDGVVLYTDGITEAEDINGVQYGLERLIEVVKENWYRSANEIRQTAIADVQHHIGKQKIYDDITLLVIKQK